MNEYTEADIDSVKYTNKERTSVCITFKKEDKLVRSNLSNRYFMAVKKWESTGGSIEPYAPTDSEQRSTAIRAITTSFKDSILTPIKFGNALFTGGIDSFIKLNAVLQLAKDASQSGVQFFDVTKMPHILSLKDARALVTQIGKRYQADLSKKNSLIFKSKNCPLEELPSVRW